MRLRQLHSFDSLLAALRAAGVETTMRVLKRDAALGRISTVRVGSKVYASSEAIGRYLGDAANAPDAIQSTADTVTE